MAPFLHIQMGVTQVYRLKLRILTSFHKNVIHYYIVLLHFFKLEGNMQLMVRYSLNNKLIKIS